ncbi:tetratricopeptide repeat-containing protein [Rhizobium sp. S96]|uniref:ATP-grasp domain-containing protein n=1 Tax=Rhizobium sp. S96 TaxID=3055140 RepID=UPI0025AAE2EE|nr:tetratricopeptide repeat-containing protein [Rhizobium sp. S96]MDM9620585.1 tetratricopeptide repeat-containing protein [Rhizobium sp. S96]
MTGTVAQIRISEDKDILIGKAAIVRTLYEGRDISPTWDKLMARVSANPRDAAAFLDLSAILQTLGKAEDASTTQQAALDISRSYRIRNGDGSGLTVLVLLTAGDFMANTPIEFLLETSNTVIRLHYVDAQTASLDDVPAHDVAFVAVGESPENLPVLENLERLLSNWAGPIVNNAPRSVIDLSREGVADAFKDEPSVLAAATTRISRNELQSVAAEEASIGSIAGIEAYPVIVRPIGTHAGKGMEKIATTAELSTYLMSRSETEFYIVPFIDYSDADGKFRKQRIAVIDGKPYASHLAISDHWMVHYLSAGMAQHNDRRLEEAAWMADFDTDFAVRHARAFDALHQHIGLDYFAIDCAELDDGRLFLFEADVAMIVHSMDSEKVFPYKKAAMNKLFVAFENALKQRAVLGASPMSHLPGAAVTHEQPWRQ